MVVANANKLCKDRADYFNSSPHANLSSIKDKGRRTGHQLNFPICYQPTACHFSFHLNQNFPRRDWGRAVDKGQWYLQKHRQKEKKILKRQMKQ